jgi:hypothetical protein
MGAGVPVDHFPPFSPSPLLPLSPSPLLFKSPLRHLS